MDALVSDLRQAARSLAHRPGFLAVAVLTLALGIGANSALFSVVNAVLLRPLPYRDVDRLAWIAYAMPVVNVEMVGGADFFEWREASRTLSGIAASSPARFILRGREQPERVTGARVSANFFSVLGVRPVRGRDFRPEEERLNAGRVALVSQRFWERFYGTRPDVQEPSVTLDDGAYTIIGVLPRDFLFPKSPDADVFIPLALDETVERSRRQMTMVRLIGRLAPGANLRQVHDELQAIHRRGEEEAFRRMAESPAPGAAAGAPEPPRRPGPGGGTMQMGFEMRRPGPGGPPGAAPGRPGGPGGPGRRPPFMQDLALKVVPLREEIVGDVRPALLVMLAAVGSVLLIACANVANLLLARATARQREIAVRAALGAGRFRIARLLLTESALLGLLGGALGLLLAFFGIRTLMAAIPPDVGNGIFRQVNVGIDGAVLLFTLALALGTGLLFGLAPAVAASRPDLQAPMKETGTGGRSSLGRRLLVALEVGLAAVLLVGAGLLLRSFVRLQTVEAGFNSEGVLTARLNVDPRKVGETAAQVAIRGVVERVRAFPGVTAAAFSDSVPTDGLHILVRGMNAEGVPPKPPEEQPEVGITVITPEYLDTLGLRLLRGRGFDERDKAGGLQAALVNETLARELWGRQDPVGRRIRGAMPGEGFLTVVGVVADARFEGPANPPKPQMFRPLAQQPFTFGYVVLRTTGDPASLTAAVRREVAALNPDQPVPEVMTLEQRLADSVAERRFNLTLLGLFALLALVLAGVGLYGVLAYAVTERTREIGVRLALGAGRNRVLGLIIRQGMLTTALGILAGLAAAFGLSRILESALFGITSRDPVTFAAIPLLLLLVALLASWLPARRATRVDPNVALRTE